MFFLPQRPALTYALRHELSRTKGFKVTALKYASLLTSLLKRKKIPYWKFIRKDFFELYSCFVIGMAVDKLCSCPKNNVIAWSCLLLMYSSRKKKMFRKTHRVPQIFSELSGMNLECQWNPHRMIRGKLLALLNTLTLFSLLGSCSRTCCIGSAKPPGHWNHFFVTRGFLRARNVIQATSLWLRKIVSAAPRIPDLNMTSI